MSLRKNISTFKNWYLFYAGRHGLLRNEFELVHRSGIMIKVRPHTDDLKIVKSNFVTKHYFKDYVPIPKDSIVVDVGAHIGAFSVMVARKAHRVLSFEPEPSNFQMLKKNKELNHLENVSIFEMAVSGSCGYQDITVYSEGSTGSHSLYQGSAKGVEKKRVQTVSLDEIIRKEALTRIDFLKLDCEGAEHDILKHMSFDTASKIQGIAMETHRVSQECFIDIPDRLKELGFEVMVEHHGGYVYARR
jgi:FkbM family methyltransferase